jgi:hypothetical protein
MEIKRDEKISLFVRDEQTDRFPFNARALRALGIDSTLAQQCGYPLTEQTDEVVEVSSSHAA